MAKLIERMQDWTVNLGASLAQNTLFKSQIVLDSDAPFCLRSIAASTESGSLAFGSLKFSDRSKDWIHTEAIFLGGATDFSGLVPNLGASGPQPVYPQEVYPPQGIIEIEFTPTAAAAIANGRLYFRGVKLYREGETLSPPYPPCYAQRKYDYTLSPVLTATQTLRNQILQIENDGDFVFRAGGVRNNPSAAANYANLYARLKDQEGKYFQDDWVHVNILFGRLLAERPALIYPEIYIPRNGMLFVDFMRNDVAAASSTTEITFSGAKVYRQ